MIKSNTPFEKQTASAVTVKTSKRRLVSRQSTIPLHLMMIPAVVILLIYSYLPMFGIIAAFQKFEITKGFFGSDFVGLYHFERLLHQHGAIQALINTIVIAFWKMVTMFFIPIIVSLLLNEVRKTYIKRGIQTLIYLPHFLSWVILAGIIREILSPRGIINDLMRDVLGIAPIFFLGEKELFQPIIIITNVWQQFGWSTIIFLAAITSVDPTLYEAAIVDGANRLRQTWHITLPGMKPIVVLCAVLSLGQILNAGFDQIFNLYSVLTYETGDIIDTFVYRISFSSGQYDVGTAVGLFRSVVSLIFITVSYWLAYRFANYEIF